MYLDIPYKNIFSNLAVDKNNLETVAISNHEKQNFLKYGDVLFTGSSESREEAGLSSVVTFNLDEKIYLNSFSFGLRFNDDINLNPEFTKYLFRGNAIRNEIAKSASGVTRYNISKASFRKIQIPIPPLDVQAKIVKILDALTALTAELTAELTMREKQYHYYRDNLLTFSDDVEWKTLAELGTLIRGNGMQKKDFTETGFPAIHYGQIYTHFGTFANTTKSYVSDELAKKLRKAHKGDVLLAGTSENIQDVMKPLGWLGDEVAISGDMFAYRPNNDLDTKYLTYLLQTTEFQKYKEKYAQGAKVTRLNTEKFLNFNVPVPSLKEQKRIANILDKFEVLTISLTEGLPREIALRQQQYEYYREQLLDFPQ